MEFLQSFFAVLMLSALVWIATGEIGERVGIRKLYLALVFGPLGGILLYKVGFMPLPIEVSDAWGMAYGAFCGLMASFAAKLWSDAVGSRIRDLINKGK